MSIPNNLFKLDYESKRDNLRDPQPTSSNIDCLVNNESCNIFIYLNNKYCK